MRNKMNQGHETLSLDSNRVGKWRIFVLNRMSLETSAANHYQNYPCTSLSPIYPKEELVKVDLVTFWRLIYSKKNNYFFLTEKKKISSKNTQPSNNFFRAVFQLFVWQPFLRAYSILKQNPLTGRELSSIRFSVATNWLVNVFVPAAQQNFSRNRRLLRPYI